MVDPSLFSLPNDKCDPCVLLLSTVILIFLKDFFSVSDRVLNEGIDASSEGFQLETIPGNFRAAL